MNIKQPTYDEILPQIKQACDNFELIDRPSFLLPIIDHFDLTHFAMAATSRFNHRLRYLQLLQSEIYHNGRLVMRVLLGCYEALHFYSKKKDISYDQYKSLLLAAIYLYADHSFGMTSQEEDTARAATALYEDAKVVNVSQDAPYLRQAIDYIKAVSEVRSGKRKLCENEEEIGAWLLVDCEAFGFYPVSDEEILKHYFGYLNEENFKRTCDYRTKDHLLSTIYKFASEEPLTAYAAEKRTATGYKKQLYRLATAVRPFNYTRVAPPRALLEEGHKSTDQMIEKWFEHYLSLG